ncbi:hypothetical protein XENORESO_015745, partial [Xenotaenia resolanae]
VLPINDEPPQLGGGLRDELRCEEGGRVQVTVDYLSATDQDSDDSRLTYMLARSPGRGELQRAGMMTDNFSQQELLQGHIYYVHSGAEIGPEPKFDTVTLIISDGEAGVTDNCCHGDAPLPPVPLHGTLPVYDLNITILPVNNKVPQVTLGKMIMNRRVSPASWFHLVLVQIAVLLQRKESLSSSYDTNNDTWPTFQRTLNDPHYPKVI